MEPEPKSGQRVLRLGILSREETVLCEVKPLTLG